MFFYGEEEYCYDHSIYVLLLVFFFLDELLLSIFWLNVSPTVEVLACLD